MKTTLTMIGLVLVLGSWIAVGDSPRTRSLEQRVADLERLVVMQSDRIDLQQAQLERVVPIVNELELITWSDGAKTIRLRSADLWVSGGSYSQFNSLVVVDNLYLFGEIVDY